MRHYYVATKDSSRKNTGHTLSHKNIKILIDIIDMICISHRRLNCLLCEFYYCRKEALDVKDTDKTEYKKLMIAIYEIETETGSDYIASVVFSSQFFTLLSYSQNYTKSQRFNSFFNQVPLCSTSEISSLLQVQY